MDPWWDPFPQPQLPGQRGRPDRYGARPQYMPGVGWLQLQSDGNNRRVYGGEGRGKLKYAWVWPRDGKRTSKRGRWKDIIQGKGPDMFLSMKPDWPGTRWNSPTKASWSNWHMFDPTNSANEDTLEDDGKEWRGFYDFRTRRYTQHPTSSTWSDARWPYPNGRRTFPKGARSIWGGWWEFPPGGLP